ncbi:cysteine/serine-rich nuclear protein 1-like [Asterias rubens]|uniref:cysteine/serine-rich nuclear protein 1-like n=1 Tax=Asterias rubens TaxID=7604 RepID=UPI001455D8D1|nr:cysteine/serine-rich nuclear protein 1-like [Asterias rubens]
MASTSSSVATTNKRKRSPSPCPSEESSPSSPEAGGSGGSCSNSHDLNAEVVVKGNTRGILGPTRKKRKRVSFDGVTVYYFRRSQGFTSVPSQGGSTLGMLPRHELKKKFSLCDYSTEQERIHRIILKRQLIEKRQQQLLERGAQELTSEDVSEEEIEDELNSINISDYYFLQPIPTKQRRALLRVAGVKKVDNLEKIDLKKIRISRESCGCDCRAYCNPATCACAAAGIKCQVDRLSFPCGCTKEGCSNPVGRVEFNPVRVRTHFIHTIMKLDGERSMNGEGPSGSDSLEEDEAHLLNRTSVDYTTSASCTKPCCDNSSSLGDNMVVGYNNSLSQVNNGQMGCTSSEVSHVYPVHNPEYEVSGGPNVEANIPIEVKQHLNVQDLIPRMLQYNDGDDTLVHHHHNHHVGMECSSDGVPTLHTYSASDDSILTSTSESSSNDSYQYNQCDEFTLKESATFAEMNKTVSSSVDSSFAEGPCAKLTTLDESSELPLGLSMGSSNTFTDLNSHIPTFAGSFGSSVTPHSSSCVTSSPSSYGNEIGIVPQGSHSDLCGYGKDAISSSTPDSVPCTTTSSYTILSALNAIDPLDEMHEHETELATSKISSVSVSVGDSFNHATNHSDFHELQNCSAEAVVSGMVTVNCPNVKLTPHDNGHDELNCFESVKSIDEQNKDESITSPHLM